MVPGFTFQIFSGLDGFTMKSPRIFTTFLLVLVVLITTVQSNPVLSAAEDGTEVALGLNSYGQHNASIGIAPEEIKATTDPQPAGVVVVSAPSGPDVTTTDNVWQDIPKMKARIVTPLAGDLIVTFCAEVDAIGGQVWLKVTDNNVSLAPDDVVFSAGSNGASHCFTFVKNNAPAGFHVIRALWNAGSATTTGSMGDRTMTITFASSAADELRLLAVAAPSGATLNTPSTWTDIPGLGGTLTLPSSSNLAITFSGEAYTDGGNRLFVRALVDDELASASDAVVAVAGYIGTRAYTFIQQNAAAGVHNVRLQYSCDVADQCHVSDRTMTVVAAGLGDTRQVVSAFNPAPSGPWQTTTNTTWENMPDTYSSFFSPSEADLAIQLTASIYLNIAGRIFVRALIDGQPTSPSDVQFEDGSWTGSHAFTFVVHNLPRGSHTLQIQWGVDGGTGYLGDRTTTAWGFASQHSVLMVAMESDRGLEGYEYGGLFSDSVVDDVGGVRTFKPYVRERLFGEAPSVAGYFLENSFGNYYMVDAGVRGPYLKQYDEYYYRNYVPDPFNTMLLEALQRVDQDNFDFSLYDRDGNGIVTSKELVTLVALYQDTEDGFVRSIPDYNTDDGVLLNNSSFPHVYLPDFQTAEQIGLIAHEQAHVLINAGDMYETSWDPTAPGPYSLMDQHFNHSHLDPYHKLHTGSWFESIPVDVDGYVIVHAVEEQPDIYKLSDPSHPGEYFLVENRQKIGYDAGLPDSGLAIWHINENEADVFRDGVMIEPACGPTNPIQWGNYLYDGAGSPWGLDFWRGSSGSNSRWVNGTDSKIGVWAIPPTSDSMWVFLDRPGSGILVDILPNELPVGAGIGSTVQIRLVNTGPSPDTFTLSSSLPGSWLQWSQNPVTLNSYEERFISVKVTPPASTPAGLVDYSITATGAAVPYPSTTHPTVFLNVLTNIVFIPSVQK